MTVIIAKVKNRRLSLEAQADWPDGTEVEIHPIVKDEAHRSAPMDRAAWLEFIEKTAGSIDDPTFVRHPQPPIEEREPLP